MATKKKKSKSTNYLLIGLIFVFLLITIKLIWWPIFRSTPLFAQLSKTYQDNKWTTFTSERAKFSFEHPISWPVTHASDEELKENNLDFIDGKWVTTNNEIENIDFQEEWVRNAGGPRLGSILVTKTDYKNLNEYVDELSKERVVDMLIKGEVQKVTIHPPKIEHLKIGGEDAIRLIHGSSLNSFTNNVLDYQLIRNGWLYVFTTTDSSRFMEDSQKNSETFKKMINSVKFFN